jgi:NADH-quinone oxidoreductase subunit L
MTSTVQNLWLIPALPLLAAGVSALLKRRHRTLAATLARNRASEYTFAV